MREELHPSNAQSTNPKPKTTTKTNPSPLPTSHQQKTHRPSPLQPTPPPFPPSPSSAPTLASVGAYFSTSLEEDSCIAPGSVFRFPVKKKEGGGGNGRKKHTWNANGSVSGAPLSLSRGFSGSVCFPPLHPHPSSYCLLWLAGMLGLLASCCLSFGAGRGSPVGSGGTEDVSLSGCQCLCLCLPLSLSLSLPLCVCVSVFVFMHVRTFLKTSRRKEKSSHPLAPQGGDAKSNRNFQADVTPTGGRGDNTEQKAAKGTILTK